MFRHYFSRFGFALYCTLSSHGLHAANIALIIDDIGNKQQDAQAFALPSEVTFSILPHKPLSETFSLRAEQQQREVMLHVPMESLTGKALGPGGLTADMYPETIKQYLNKALLTVPNAMGVNNHMGSKLTQLTLPMSATMEFLQQRGLYFVDSRTTRFSKAELIAKQKGVLSTRRNVFLDHVVSHEHIDRQFQRLLRLAKKHGHAVGIAHPYPQSMQYLQENLPKLTGQGVTLVPLSYLLGQQQKLALTVTSGSTSEAFPHVTPTPNYGEIADQKNTALED